MRKLQQENRSLAVRNSASGSGGQRAEVQQLQLRCAREEPKCVDLDFPGGAQTRANPGESFVLVAGMGDQFPAPVGNRGQQLFESGAVKHARGKDADRAVGGHKAFVGDDAVEGAPEELKRAELSAASEGYAMRCALAPARFKGIADAMDACSPRGAQDWAHEGRELVQVFVGVDVSQSNSGVLKACDLSKGFRFEECFSLAAVDAGSKECAQELSWRGRQLAGAAVGPVDP